MPPNNASETKSTLTKTKRKINISHATLTQNSPSLHDDPRLFEETLSIVQFVIHSILGRNVDGVASPVRKRAHELTSEILAQHDVYNNVCENLNLTSTNLEENFCGVAETVFEDGIINWGRLIALLGFSVKIAEYVSVKGFGNHDDRVAELTTHFIVNRMGAWIRSKGGWVSLFFLVWVVSTIIFILKG